MKKHPGRGRPAGVSDALRRCAWGVADHGEQYSKDFAHTFNVILWQIDTKRTTFKSQKLPDIPSRYGTVHGHQASAFPRIEVLGSDHHCTTLAQADLEIFIFGLDNHHYRGAHEELLSRLRNE